GKRWETEHNVAYVEDDQQTMMVSLKTAGTAVGSLINFDHENKTMTLKNQDSTWELRLHSDQAVVINNDGSRQKKQLQQPVKLDQGRAYIDVRDLADMLHRRVIWYEAEIVIL